MKKIMLLFCCFLSYSICLAQQRVEIYLGKNIFFESKIPANWKKGTSAIGNETSYYSPDSRFTIKYSPEWKQGRTVIQVLNDKIKDLKQPLRSERTTIKKDEWEAVVDKTITTAAKKEVGRVRVVIDVYAVRNALFVEIELPAVLNESEKK